VEHPPPTRKVADVAEVRGTIPRAREVTDEARADTRSQAGPATGRQDTHPLQVRDTARLVRGLPRHAEEEAHRLAVHDNEARGVRCDERRVVREQSARRGGVERRRSERREALVLEPVEQGGLLVEPREVEGPQLDVGRRSGPREEEGEYPHGACEREPVDRQAPQLVETRGREVAVLVGPVGAVLRGGLPSERGRRIGAPKPRARTRADEPAAQRVQPRPDESLGTPRAVPRLARLQ
jgi:hypothetical protein